MKVLLYHKDDYIFDKTDDDLITVSILFKHNERHKLKNNYALFNFFQYYIVLKINNSMFDAINIIFNNSTLSLSFSKENTEVLLKMIEYFFRQEKNYTDYLEKYLQRIEKNQANDSYVEIDKILFSNSSIFNDPKTLYNESRKLKNTDIEEFMNIVMDIKNLFIIISGHDDKEYKDILFKTIPDNKVLVLGTEYYKEDEPKLIEMLSTKKQYNISSTKNTMTEINFYFFYHNSKAEIDIAFLHKFINLNEISEKYYADCNTYYSNIYPYQNICIIISLEPRFVKDCINDVFLYLKNLKTKVSEVQLEKAKKRKIFALDYVLSFTDSRHKEIIYNYNLLEKNFNFKEQRKNYQNIKLEDVERELGKLFIEKNLKMFIIGVPFKDKIKIEL